MALQDFADGRGQPQLQGIARVEPAGIGIGQLMGFSENVAGQGGDLQFEVGKNMAEIGQRRIKFNLQPKALFTEGSGAEGVRGFRQTPQTAPDPGRRAAFQQNLTAIFDQ